ncbi:MAG: DUF2283 domain-containing protein [Proteobacteria bacterium]|nr:DUF2283 domain-containing protein [Pseudomonadota bacterium]
MKINYDVATDSLYIDFREIQIAQSKEVSKDVNIDYAKNGSLVKINIQNASNYVDFRKMTSNIFSFRENEPLLPHDVVTTIMLDGDSMLKAWRRHTSLTQAELADRVGMTQAGIAQLERPGGIMRKATLEKLAAALEIEPQQLKEVG